MKVVYSIPDHVEDSFYDLLEINGHEVIRPHSASLFPDFPDADLYIDGTFSGEFFGSVGPLLIHAPSLTWNYLKNAPPNSARFCAWPGFWKRNLWEFAPNPQSAVDWLSLFQQLGIPGKEVPDIEGLIAPRILATIVNEAIYCIEDKIADAVDIDIAMRLGTNYPKGPIEWARQIGFNEIYELLKILSIADKRYAPHPNFLNYVSL